MKKIYLFITFLLICLLVSCGGEETPTVSTSTNQTVVPTTNVPTVVPTVALTTNVPTVVPTVVPTTNAPTVVPTVNPTTQTPSKYKPELSNDGKTVLYGYYPQTRVSDNTIISTLERLIPNENGWYYFDDTYYVRKTSTIYNGESYNFIDGSKILDNTTYWFKCEPIKWRVLSVLDNKYTLISDVLLDTQAYYEQYTTRTIDGNEIFSNNYEYSDIRKWLNTEFYNTAFNLNNAYLTEVSIDNSASTTDSFTNKYESNNTLDKVYLPSYQDMLNQSFGFDCSNGVSTSRQAKTTDYARAVGAWSNTRDSQYLYNSTYWTRSAVSTYYYCAWNVNSSGNLSKYAVDGSQHCVRPCITIIL